MNDGKTGCRLAHAASKEPTLGPMHVPSVAAWYACGRFGATPYRRCNPSSSNRKIEHNIPSLWASIRRVILVRTSFRDAPMSIIFSASSTASLGRVCAGDGGLESACRLGNVLTFAINWPPTPAASHKQSIYITKGRHAARTSHSNGTSWFATCTVLVPYTCLCLV